MRKLLCILSVLAMAAFASNAEMLFYKGTLKVRQSGDGSDARQSVRVWLVLDRATGTVGRINYYPENGFYTLEPDQVLSTNVVRLPEQKTVTVLATAGSDSTDGATRVNATFARGTNSRQQVARNTYVSIPRVLDWNARGIGPVGDPAATELLEETGVLTLQSTNTISSNNKGEDFAAAKARVTQLLESAGYREIVIK